MNKKGLLNISGSKIEGYVTEGISEGLLSVGQLDTQLKAITIFMDGSVYAMEEYGRKSSMKSMGQELLGIVKRKVWKPILKI